MNAEAKPQRAYSASEQGFQRLLLREQKNQSQPGDGLKRTGLNLSILVGSTVADLGESHLVDKLLRKPMEHAVEAAHEKAVSFSKDVFAQKHTDPETLDAAFASAREKLVDAAKTKQGTQLAAEFVEEWASDSIYAGMANSWVRLMTGVDEAKYVSETSAFISEWANKISQVFGNDRLFGRTRIQGTKLVPDRWHGIKLAYQSMDFINSVNVEAALRVIEEIPVVGDGVAWIHEKTDKMLEGTLAKIGNTTAATGILGYHIGRNVKPL
ncbi:hypothetical protein KJZ67_02965 [Patescibacteria group bacterium]|nr:hypothetical protein [Patescibacteria group bacterium]